MNKPYAPPAAAVVQDTRLAELNTGELQALRRGTSHLRAHVLFQGLMAFLFGAAAFFQAGYHSVSASEVGVLIGASGAFALSCQATGLRYPWARSLALLTGAGLCFFGVYRTLQYGELVLGPFVLCAMHGSLALCAFRHTGLLFAPEPLKPGDVRREVRARRACTKQDGAGCGGADVVDGQAMERAA